MTNSKNETDTVLSSGLQAHKIQIKSSFLISFLNRKNLLSAERKKKTFGNFTFLIIPECENCPKTIAKNLSNVPEY